MKDKIRVKFLRYKNIVLAEVIPLPKKYENDRLLLEDHEAGYNLLVGEALVLEKNSLILSSLNDEVPMDNIAFHRYYSEGRAKYAVETFSRLIHEVNKRDEEKEYINIDMTGMETTLAD